MGILYMSAVFKSGELMKCIAVMKPASMSFFG